MKIETELKYILIGLLCLISSSTTSLTGIYSPAYLVLGGVFLAASGIIGEIKKGPRK